MMLPATGFESSAYALRAGRADEHRQRLERLRPWYSKFLENWLPKDNGARILDVPCGGGNLLFALKSSGFTNLSGADADVGQIELAKSLGLPAAICDAFEFVAREPAGSVERIFSLDFIEHVPPEQALEFCRSVYRALLAGGVFACRTPCADGPFGSHDRYNDITHRWALTTEAAVQLFSLAGFSRDAVVLRDEGPVPYKFTNRLRAGLFRTTTAAMGRYLDLVGIGAPRIWTRSMWIFATK